VTTWKPTASAAALLGIVRRASCAGPRSGFARHCAGTAGFQIQCCAKLLVDQVRRHLQFGVSFWCTSPAPGKASLGF